MVVFVDLEHEGEDDESGSLLNLALRSYPPFDQSHGIDKQPAVGIKDRKASLLAAVLACFPVSRALASHLDLNDLFALSSTCRPVHDALIQFASYLRRDSLRCINEEPLCVWTRPDDLEHMQEGSGEDVEEQGAVGTRENPQAALPSWAGTRLSHYHSNPSSALGLTGKVRKCARDLVSPCRKCGVVVCRNCAVKPPSARCFPERFRRLCRTCLDAPMQDHLEPLSSRRDYHESTPASSASSARSVSSSSAGSVLFDHTPNQDWAEDGTVAVPAFLRTPCECDSHGVYLCQPCGQSLCAANTTYQRVWTWRSRYSTHIGGGLGTGLGQGEQGQKCGRGEYCLERGAAGICWVEIDCSESRAQSSEHRDYYQNNRSSASRSSEHVSGYLQNKPGYFSQEIEGIGGVVKKKVKKRIKVGATVYEFDDERASGKYLERESSGKQRSWCGWCFRVCPGTDDGSAIGLPARSI